MERQDGLQHERTGLAWNRTGAGLIVAGAVFLASGGPPYHPALHAPGLVMMALGALFVGYGLRRAVRTNQRPRPPTLAVRIMAASVLLFSLCAAALVLHGA